MATPATALPSSTEHAGRRDADRWRRGVAGLLLLPVGAVSVAAFLAGHRQWSAEHQAALGRRTSGRFVPMAGPGRTLVASMLGVSLGGLAWVVALLAGPNTIRNVLLYGLVGGDTTHSWGGPTLAGAWLVHASLAIALLPVELALMQGIASLHALFLDDRRPWWIQPLALLVAAAGTLVVVALVHQL